MQPTSNAYKQSLGAFQRRDTRITAQPPGEAAIQVAFSSGSVSADNSRSARYQASLVFPPSLGQGLFDKLAIPGTIIDIDEGVNLGSYVEWIDLFYGEIVSGSADVFSGAVSVSLADMWTRIDRCRFLTPYVPVPNSTRVQVITKVITDAVPGTIVNVEPGILDGGGVIPTELVGDKSRTQFIDDVKKDASLEVYFQPNGQLMIRRTPTLDPMSSVWTFQSGELSNLISAERTRPFDRLYNTVVVKPATDEQFWDAQVATIEDLSHPRHHSKIGYVPFFYASPSIQSNENALAVAKNRLQDILGLTETASLGTASNVALEPGDVVTIVHQATGIDPGFTAAHLIDSWNLDLISGEMAVDTRSSNIVDLEEVEV